MNKQNDQIQSIYQVGNMLVYNGHNILLENKTAYRALEGFLTKRELNVLNQYINERFNGDVNQYNNYLLTIGAIHGE